MVDRVPHHLYGLLLFDVKLDMEQEGCCTTDSNDDPRSFEIDVGVWELLGSEHTKEQELAHEQEEESVRDIAALVVMRMEFELI